MELKENVRISVFQKLDLMALAIVSAN